MNARCACGATLGTQAQPGLPGTNTPEKCIKCVTKDRTRHMLVMLPDEGTREFGSLNEFEQKFLPSVRKQFRQKGAVSERQYEVLEKIYERQR